MKMSGCQGLNGFVASEIGATEWGLHRPGGLSRPESESFKGFIGEDGEDYFGAPDVCVCVFFCFFIVFLFLCVLVIFFFRFCRPALNSEYFKNGRVGSAWHGKAVRTKIRAASEELLFGLSTLSAINGT